LLLIFCLTWFLKLLQLLKAILKYGQVGILLKYVDLHVGTYESSKPAIKRDSIFVDICKVSQTTDAYILYLFIPYTI